MQGLMKIASISLVQFYRYFQHQNPNQCIVKRNAGESSEFLMKHAQGKLLHALLGTQRNTGDGL